MENEVRLAILEKVRKRCYLCIHFMNVFQNIYGFLNLKFKPYYPEDYNNFCKYAIFKYRHTILKEVEDNRVHTTYSPYDRHPHLEDEDGNYNDITFRISKYTPSCEGFELRKLVSSHDGKYTQFSWGQYIAKVKDCTPERKKQILKVLLKAKKWSTMTKVNGQWVQLSNKDKTQLIMRFREKLTITGFMDEIVYLLDELKFVGTPRSPVIDVPWRNLNEQTRNLYMFMSKVDPVTGLSKFADELLIKNKLEYLVDKVEKLSKRVPVDTRRRMRILGFAKWEHVEHEECTLANYFKVKKSILFDDPEKCLYCGINLGEKDRIVRNNILSLMLFDQRRWIESRVKLNKLCPSCMGQLQEEYTELIKRGAIQLLDDYDEESDETMDLPNDDPLKHWKYESLYI